MSIDLLMMCDRLTIKPKHIINRRNFELVQARKQFTDKELATAANITTKTLHDIRCCKTSPSNFTLMQLAAALSTDYSTLIAADHTPQKPITICYEKLRTKIKSAGLSYCKSIEQALMGKNFFWEIKHKPNKTWRPYIIGRAAATLGIDPIEIIV